MQAYVRPNDAPTSRIDKSILVRECSVSGCFGSLAYRTWHESGVGCKRVLLLHDMHDNTGIFDKLIPELGHPDGVFIVGLDLPGHGRSQGLPSGSIYLDTTIVNEIRRFVKHLAWHQCDHAAKRKHSRGEAESGEGAPTREKFVIMGHGEGAGLAMFYARLYPEDVERIVALDFVKLQKDRPMELLRETAIYMDRIVDVKLDIADSKLAGPKELAGLDRNSDYWSVLKEKAILKAIQRRSSRGRLSPDQALHLVERSNQSLTVGGDSIDEQQQKQQEKQMIMLKGDKRVANYMNTRVYGELNPRNAADGLECHLSVILARNGRHKNGKDLEDLDDVVDEYKKQCKSFQLDWIEDADHYFVINRIDSVSAKINQALNPETA